MPTLWFEAALLPEGWSDGVRVRIEGGRISAIEANVAPEPGEARHGAALPGLCNVHSHAFQRGMAGLAETRGPAHDNFWTWRVEMYRFLDRLTPEDVASIAALAYCEMLESGFTRVGEFHYLHHDASGGPYADVAAMAKAIAAAAEETGLALTLLPVLYAHSNFGAAPPTPGQRRFICDVDQFAQLYEASRKAIAPLPEAQIGVAPHSLRAVTPEQLRFAAALGAGPVHIHAAEQTKEVDDCIAWSGLRPVEWLLQHAELNTRWCLIHATHLTAAETDALAASGACAGLCPVTEANLGDGIFPAQRFLAAGGAFSVGTDSNILIDAAMELRSLEYAQRLDLRARNVLGSAIGASIGAALFKGAQQGGAQALGADAQGLCPGAPADIVALSRDHVSLTGRKHDRLLDAWIFSAGAAAVDCVWRHGALVVEGGRHLKGEAIRARYRQTMAHLLDD